MPAPRPPTMAFNHGLNPRVNGVFRPMYLAPGDFDGFQHRLPVTVGRLGMFIGTAHRERAVEESEPESVQIGLAHLHPGESAARKRFSAVPGRTVGIRTENRRPAQLRVAIQLRRVAAGRLRLHGEYLVAVQRLLQSRALHLPEEPLLAVHMRRNHDAAGPVDFPGDLGEGLRRHLFARTLAAGETDGSEQGVDVRRGRFARENGQKMHTSRYRYFDPREQVTGAGSRQEGRRPTRSVRFAEDRSRRRCCGP